MPENQAPLLELLPSDDDGRATTCCTNNGRRQQVRRQGFMHAMPDAAGASQVKREHNLPASGLVEVEHIIMITKQ